MSEKPKIANIKIKMRPIGEIVINVTGGDPQYFATTINLSIVDSNEPNCTNNPVPAPWSATEQAYIGQATFDEDLVPSSYGYDADVTFFLSGVNDGTERGIPVEVLAPPSV